VTVAVIGGTATADTDFTAVPDLTITIPAGDSSASTTFTLEALDDAEVEGPETVRLLPQAPAGLTVAEVTVEITDNEVASDSLTLTADPAQVNEGGGATAVTVTAALDGAVRSDATIVTVTVTPGTAEAGTDYTAPGSFEVTIPAGATAGTATIMLTPVDDLNAEDVETIELTGTTAAGLTVTGASIGIIDDDVASTGVTLTVAPLEVEEAAGAFLSFLQRRRSR
jgi:hypothetical protein